MITGNSNRKMEKTEWCNLRWLNTNDDQLPRVLLIGDSITGGYNTVVSRILQEKANLAYLTTSKGINDIGLIKETSYVMEDFNYHIVHFNNGLHGWHINDQDYELALRNYLELLRQLSKGAKLIWANSTPYLTREELVPDPGKNSIVIRRNAIANRIMVENKVRVNDLYTVTFGKTALFTDGVHYNRDGYELLGSAVADVIMEELN
ncbi:MAG: hypothetical protein JWN30_2844 [Bacilli bacterium]|nr:hypothetical protein [Bacilli bacterium]